MTSDKNNFIFIRSLTDIRNKSSFFSLSHTNLFALLYLLQYSFLDSQFLHQVSMQLCNIFQCFSNFTNRFCYILAPTTHSDTFCSIPYLVRGAKCIFCKHILIDIPLDFCWNNLPPIILCPKSTRLSFMPWGIRC